MLASCYMVRTDSATNGRTTVTYGNLADDIHAITGKFAHNFNEFIINVNGDAQVRTGAVMFENV